MYQRSPVEKLADHLNKAPAQERDTALFEGIHEWIETSLIITLGKAQRAAWTEARIPGPEATRIILRAMRAALHSVEEQEGLLP